MDINNNVSVLLYFVTNFINNLIKYMTHTKLSSLLALLIMGLFVLACNNAQQNTEEDNTDQTEQTMEATDNGSADDVQEADQSGKEYTSAYICPMHCEGSGSDKMGTCPVCGMDYVKNEKQKNDHDHDHGDHDGHNH